MMRLVLRSFRERPEWLAIGLLALSVSTALVTGLVALEREVPARLRETLARSGPNLTVVPPAGSAALSMADALAAQRTLHARPGVTSARFLVGNVRARSLRQNERLGAPRDSSDDAHVVLVGTDISEAVHLYPSWNVSGRWPRTDHAECVIGSSVESMLAVPRGSTLFLNGPTASDSLRVVGVLHTGGVEEAQILTEFSLASRLLNAPGVSFVAARVSGTEAEAQAAAVTRAVPRVDARVVRRVAQAEDRVLAVVRAVLLLSVMTILVCSSVALTATLSTVVAEREREIGVMRALGAGHGRIALLFAGEAVAAGLAGGALGYAAGALLADVLGRRIFGVSVPAGLDLMGLAFAVALGLAAAGSVAPIWRALHVEPAVILRGE
jgi:putative ABC transport system permease protein